MYLTPIALEGTLSLKLQLLNGNAPQTADAAPTFRVYGASDTAVLTGTCSAVIDGQTGLHKITIAATSANGFTRGAYTIRLSYAVSDVVKVQFYSFNVV